MESKKPWTTSDRPCAGLFIARKESAYSLPWGQFVVAHGDDLIVHAMWTTHVVTFRGSGLVELFQDISGQVIERVTVSPRTDQFLRGPFIESVEVDEIED